jgi:hypothetical protein
MSTVQDIGAYINAHMAGYSDAVAGGTGDATEVDGPEFDRLGYRSCAVYLLYSATLAEDETLSLAANLQDSATTGTGYADYGTALASAVVATGDTGGSTETGATKVGDFDLTTANRYMRLQFTPDLSAANTDTSDVIGVVILGGKDVNPAS